MNIEKICKIQKIWKIWKKIVKWFGKYRRKASWIVKIYGNYGRKVSWNVKWYGNYGRKFWNDMEIKEENSQHIWEIQEKIVKR